MTATHNTVLEMPSLSEPLATRAASVPQATSTHHATESSLRQVGQSDDFSFPNVQSTVDAMALVEKINASMTIGADDCVEGKIKVGSGKSVIIRGKFIGDIECRGCVLLMKEGSIQGTVRAGQLWVEGEIGQIEEGKQSIVDVGTLHIGKGALVQADIVYSSMSMETPNRGVRGRMDYREAREG